MRWTPAVAQQGISLCRLSHTAVLFRPSRAVRTATLASVLLLLLFLLLAVVEVFLLRGSPQRHDLSAALSTLTPPQGAKGYRRRKLRLQSLLLPTPTTQRLRPSSQAPPEERHWQSFAAGMAGVLARLDQRRCNASPSSAVACGTSSVDCANKRTIELKERNKALRLRQPSRSPAASNVVLAKLHFCILACINTACSRESVTWIL